MENLSEKVDTALKYLDSFSEDEAKELAIVLRHDSNKKRYFDIFFGVSKQAYHEK